MYVLKNGIYYFAGETEDYFGKTPFYSPIKAIIFNTYEDVQNRLNNIHRAHIQNFEVIEIGETDYDYS